MKSIKGKTLCKGIAIGKIHIIGSNDFPVKHIKIENIEKEIKRVEEAKFRVNKELQDLYNKAVVEIGENEAEIFHVHQMMLNDKDYEKTIKDIIKNEKVNAEYAVSITGASFSSMFEKIKNEYMKVRANDIKDITNRIIKCLRNENDKISKKYIINNITEPMVIVAEELTPSEILLLNRKKILAFVIKKCSSHSHAAILIKAMNIPTIIGIDFDINQLILGKEAIVDSYLGKLIIEPTEKIKEEARVKLKIEQMKKKTLKNLERKETVTLSGKKIRLYANIENVDGLDDALKNDAEGIGLFRSEFMYIGRTNPPGEEEQFNIYKQLAQTMKDKKVIVRTFDIGADKKASYLRLGNENNPLLGLRGIRVYWEKVHVFKTQLRALYRAAMYGNISIMYPMITDIEEVKAIKQISTEVKKELKEKQIPYKDVEEGVMIETPAAVMVSDELAKIVDFFSIGTNDLTQYTLAIDRQNASLETLYNPHHKAIIKMIKIAIDNAHKEGKWVGICGELASDISLTESLVNMGIDEFSVEPSNILILRQIIRQLI